LPSTVSRKVITQAAAMPAAHWPVQKSQKARMTKPRLAVVTVFGEMRSQAQKRVAWKAGIGQAYLVTMSVTPL
jgi:hypothetical protein